MNLAGDVEETHDSAVDRVPALYGVLRRQKRDNNEVLGEERLRLPERAARAQACRSR